jgi:hypothetical protein
MNSLSQQKYVQNLFQNTIINKDAKMLLSQKVLQSAVEVIERGRPLSPAILYDLAVLVDSICLSDDIVTLPAGCGKDIEGTDLQKELKQENLALPENPKAKGAFLKKGCNDIIKSLHAPNRLTDRLIEILDQQVTKFIEPPNSHRGEKESIAYPLLQLDDLLNTQTEEEAAIYYARSFLYWIEATQARKDTLVMDYGRIPFLNSFINTYNDILSKKIRAEIFNGIENEREKLLEFACEFGNEVYPLPLLLSIVLKKCRGDKRAIITELITLRNKLSRDRSNLKEIENKIHKARSHNDLKKIKNNVKKLKDAIFKQFGSSDSAHSIIKYSNKALETLVDPGLKAFKNLIPIDELVAWLQTRPTAKLVSLRKAESLVDYHTLNQLFGDLPSKNDFQSAYSLYRLGGLR